MRSRFYTLFGCVIGLCLGVFIGFFLGLNVYGFFEYFKMYTEENKEEYKEEKLLQEEIENRTTFLALNGINIDLNELNDRNGKEICEYLKSLALSEEDIAIVGEAYVSDIKEMKELNISNFETFDLIPQDFIMAPTHGSLRVEAKYGDISIILLFNSSDKVTYRNITLDNIGIEFKLANILVIAPKEDYNVSLFERPWTKTKDSQGNIIYRDRVDDYKIYYQNPAEGKKLNLLITTQASDLDWEQYFEEQYYIY